MQVNYARSTEGFHGFYFVNKWPRMKSELKKYRITTLEKPFFMVYGERDRCDLNFYHSVCPKCGEFIMFNPGEVRKPCQKCGSYLKLVNRGRTADETENLISEHLYFNA